MYALLGRGLTLAADFELGCQLLAGALGLLNERRTNFDLEDQRARHEFCIAIKDTRLFLNLEYVKEHYSVTSEFSDSLDTARVARNYLVHQAPLAMAVLLREGAGESDLFWNLQTRLYEIWQAAFQVYFLLLAHHGLASDKIANADEWQEWILGIGNLPEKKRWRKDSGA